MSRSNPKGDQRQEDAAGVLAGDASAEIAEIQQQKKIKAAASRVASLISFDDRYARAIAFVSDASENDEVASMLMQVGHASKTPVNLIKWLVRAEFDINAASKETILRTNSLASKSFGLYARVICRKYVCSHVLPVVRDIIQNSNSLEINPDVLMKQPSILQLPEDQRDAAVRDAIALNSALLARYVSSVIEGLSSPAALLALPPFIISIFKFVGAMSTEINMYLPPYTSADLILH